MGWEERQGWVRRIEILERDVKKLKMELIEMKFGKPTKDQSVGVTSLSNETKFGLGE